MSKKVKQEENRTKRELMNAGYSNPRLRILKLIIRIFMKERISRSKHPSLQRRTTKNSKYLLSHKFLAQRKINYGHLTSFVDLARDDLVH